MKIPNTAILHMPANNGQPQFSRMAIRHIGVYDEAISTKIIIWSIRFKWLIPLSERGSQWYKVLAVYKRIKPIQKVSNEAKCHGLKGIVVARIKITVPAIASNAPMKWVNPLMGSRNLSFICIPYFVSPNYTHKKWWKQTINEQWFINCNNNFE